MAIQVTIGGSVRNVDYKSIRISDVLTSRVNTCGFDMYLISPATKPKEGQEAIIALDGTRIFGGRVAVAVETEPLPGELRYTVTCVDYTKEADKLLVVDVYPAGMTRGAIARDIVTKYCPGFTATAANVPDGPVMPEMRFDYKWPSECFTQLCEGSVGDWYWDYEKGLHVFTSEEAYAPFDVTDDGTGEHPSDLVIAPDIQDIATRVYVLGGEYFGNTFSQRFKGDGEAREFPLAYKPKTVVVTLNGAAQTIAADDLLNQVVDPDWTFNHQEKLLKRGPDKATPGAVDVIEVTYNPLLPVRVVMDDSDAQTKLGALMGNDGIFEANMVDHSLTSKEAAKLAGKAYLAKHANPLIQGGYTTLRGGLRSGMRQRLRLAGRSVDLEILIGEVTRTPESGSLWRYSVTFATHLMGVEDLIRQLMDAQKRTTPREDEALDIILGLKDPLPPTDTVAVTEVTQFRAIADGVIRAGFCEAADQLAEVDSRADWEAGTVPAEADVTNNPGTVLLARRVDGDISTGKEAGMSSSSYYGAGYTPDNLVDGSIVFGGGTAYASENGAPLPQYVQIDLGAHYALYRVEWINNRQLARLPGDYQIAISQTGAFAGEETVVAQVVGNTTWSTWVTHDFAAVRARYVRMKVTAISGGGAYFEFAEWRIHGMDFYPSATIITKTLDLGAAPPRPILVYADAGTLPAGTAITVDEVRTSPDGLAWGAWAAVTVEGITPWTPDRYLQAKVTLATTDTTATPTLYQVGAYD